MIPTLALSDAGPRVALCDRCARDRTLEARLAGGVSIAIDAKAIVLSGTCHDCGGGWCACRGKLRCDLCPLTMSPVMVPELFAYAIEVPPAPETIPAPFGGES